MKIIFLDYDGVVNNLVFQDINGEPNFNFPKLEQVSDKQAVAWLNKICREFDAKIVVTSTWRGRPDYAECLYRAGFSGEIIGKTTSKGGLAGHRGTQIKQWFENNQEYKNVDFIILDDDADMKPYVDHLIQTDSIRGLGYYEYEKICKRWEADFPYKIKNQKDE